ncbi:hypothetical protein [Rubrobacter aplysinae]|uniref:hypothetical protein n=1 Tax=Rubrobacter aplysinae TaxID=909625 RepID=UPI00064C12AA|nr:hypothetical protein [Rubrobacter aplysinae]
MSEDSRGEYLSPKEYSESTLKAARMYHLCGEDGDSWSSVALAVCAFEGLHTKDGWEFVLTNRRDIEDVAELFGKAGSPEEFRDGLMDLKEKDLKRRMGVG